MFQIRSVLLIAAAITLPTVGNGATLYVDEGPAGGYEVDSSRCRPRLRPWQGCTDGYTPPLTGQSPPAGLCEAPATGRTDAKGRRQP